MTENNNNKEFHIEDYRDILFNVYELARERSQNEEGADNTFSFTSPHFDVDEIVAKRETSKLLNYLQSLDMDSIKVIQTVMYIGRDYEMEPYSDEEMEVFIERQADDPEYQIPEKQIVVSDSNKVVNEWMNEIKNGTGWESKEIEINQIYGKSPLDLYLQRAFRILQIR